ncbi:MAG: VOC family protein [Bacteroidetes bacterium]|nr:VOC family protein [Bacteroidota bacterium]
MQETKAFLILYVLTAGESSTNIIAPAMASTFKPTGYPSISPYLVVADIQACIDFICATLDGTPLRRIERPDGCIMHAEVRVDDSVLMIGGAGELWPSVPCHLHIYVTDVDVTFKKALTNGATVIHEPEQKEGDSDKRGGVLGPCGNSWWFSTQMNP